MASCPCQRPGVKPAFSNSVMATGVVISLPRTRFSLASISWPGWTEDSPAAFARTFLCHRHSHGMCLLTFVGEFFPVQYDGSLAKRMLTMIQLRGFLGKRGEIDGIRQHLFAGLPCGALASLRPGPPSVRCSSGYLIYLQGTEATCFYYLKKGKVKSFIQSEDGAERTLNLYQQGSIFGEASIF